MSHHILLLGKTKKSYQFIQPILDRPHYNLKYIPVDEFKIENQDLEKREETTVATALCGKGGLGFHDMA